MILTSAADGSDASEYVVEWEGREWEKERAALDLEGKGRALLINDSFPRDIQLDRRQTPKWEFDVV